MSLCCAQGTPRYPQKCTLPELRGPSGQPWKSINFQASLQGNKGHENWSQGHPKSWKNDLGITRNPISAKVDFCNTFHAKCLFLQSRTPRFRSQNHSNNWPGSKHEKRHLFWSKVPEKLSKWGPEIHPKSIKIKVWTPRRPSCIPRSPWIAPMVPQGAKVEAPGMPNDWFWEPKVTISVSKIKVIWKNMIWKPTSRNQRASTHFSRGT